MNIVFDIAAVITVFATLMVITRTHVVHALLYAVVSFLSLSFIFFLLGAPFVAALEVIVYAGAIMVLFIFLVMLLNLGPQTTHQEKEWLKGKFWIGPVILSSVLLTELIYVAIQDTSPMTTGVEIGPEEVGYALFTQYLLGVELASVVLLGGLVGAYHLGRKETWEETEEKP